MSIPVLIGLLMYGCISLEEKPSIFGFALQLVIDKPSNAPILSELKDEVLVRGNVGYDQRQTIYKEFIGIAFHPLPSAKYS